MAKDIHISRREALVAAGVIAGGGGVYALRPTPAYGSDAASCVLAPEMTEGPYYLDDHLMRRDITEGKDGVPLQLRLTVQSASSCKPIARATVEVWQADATGNYSGFDNAAAPTHYLRGGQRTNRSGLAVIDTVYPGWYQGRTPHIHVKVHVRGNVVHTGQLFFRPSTSAAVYRASAYAAHGQADTTNATDPIYAAGGSKSLLALRRRTGGGYTGAIALGVRT
jgi:protocatechuate 3,4-dioxygenase beta subunit